MPEADREVETVKWFNAAKGYGFVTRENGDSIFVRLASIRGEGHRTLQDGQQLEFVAA